MRKDSLTALRVLAHSKSASRLALVLGLGAPKTHLEVHIMNNQLTIIGRVGQSPVSRTMPESENKVVKFSLGVTEYNSKKDEESTLWIDVDAWNGLGERVMQTVTKGREVLLTGRLAISKFTKTVDGNTIEVHKPVLKLTSFHLCGPKPKAESETAGEAEASESKKRTRKSA